MRRFGTSSSQTTSWRTPAGQSGQYAIILAHPTGRTPALDIDSSLRRDHQWLSDPKARPSDRSFSDLPPFHAWVVSVVLLLSGFSQSSLAQAPPVSLSAPATATTPAAIGTPPAGAAATAAAKPAPTAAELQRAAIALQRAAIRKQAENLGLWLMPLDEKPRREIADPPDCDPLEEKLVNPLIDDAAKQNGLEPKLIRAVVERESAFRPCAVSAKGAQGLMQLMPETAAELGVADPFDPKQSVDAGARYLKQLIDKYKGDLPQALGAYNAGPQNVDDSGGVPDLQETRDYVDAVLTRAGL